MSLAATIDMHQPYHGCPKLLRYGVLIKMPTRDKKMGHRLPPQARIRYVLIRTVFIYVSSWLRANRVGRLERNWVTQIPREHDKSWGVVGTLQAQEKSRSASKPKIGVYNLTEGC